MKIGIHTKTIYRDIHNPMDAKQKELIKRLESAGHTICYVVDRLDGIKDDIEIIREEEWVKANGLEVREIVLAEEYESDTCYKYGINYMIRDVLNEETFDSISKVTGYITIDEPHIKNYDEKLLSEPIPRMTAYQLVKSYNSEKKSKVAFNFMGNKITYSEFISQVDKVADSLKAMGINEGDVVTSTLPTIPESAYVLYGIAKIGAIANLIDPTYNPKEITRFVNEVGSKIFITMDVFYDGIGEYLEESTIQSVVTVPVYNSLPLIPKLITKCKSQSTKYCPNNYDIKNWREFINLSNDKTKVEDVAYKPDRPFVIIPTGGTTGVPKSVVLSHDNVNAAGWQLLRCLDYSCGEKSLMLIPVFTSYGLSDSMHAGVVAGLENILVPINDPATITKLLMKHKPHRTALAPAHYEYICSTPMTKNADFSNLEPIVGGATLQRAFELLLNKKLAATGCKWKIKKGYGLTETAAGVCVCKNNDLNELGGVGIPFSHTTIAIFDEKEEELKYNEEGEICIKGPGVMLGYYKNKEATDEALHVHSDGDVWLHTGDIGYVNQDGKLFVLDRKKRMISRSDGRKIYPLKVENAISFHESVQSVIVIGVPDPNYHQGSLPIAYVVLKDTVIDKQRALVEITNLCKENLTNFEVPSEIFAIDVMPKNSMGKPKPEVLINEYINSPKYKKLLNK